VDDFNKIQVYKGCLKNPHSKVRNFSVGGLKLDERLVAFIVSWILTPRVMEKCLHDFGVLLVNGGNIMD